MVCTALLRLSFMGTKAFKPIVSPYFHAPITSGWNQENFRMPRAKKAIEAHDEAEG